MIIKSFSSHRLPKLALNILLALACSLGSAQAVISNRQARDAAATILQAAPADRYNRAVEVAQSITKNTNPADAAANSAKIVSYLPSKAQRLFAGRVGVGIALNFPNQLPSITLKLISLNNNLRNNASLVVYQMAAAGGFDQAQQIAAALSLVMHRNERIGDQIEPITISLLSAISNRVGFSPLERANELAFVSANLSVSVIGGSKKLSSSQDRQLRLIALTFSNYIKTLVKNNPKSASLVYNAVGNFANTLKQAVRSSVSSSTLNHILVQTSIILQRAIPTEAASVQKAVQDIMDNHPNQIDTGNVIDRETPYVDSNNHQIILR